MAIIQFDNGQKVKFDGTPTERDVEEVAQKLGITKKKSFFQKAGDFFTSSTQKFAKTLGTAASVIDPKTKKLREETISSTQKLVDEYTQKAKNEPNKERAKKFLEVAQKLADTENIDIYNNPEYQKTAKQIYGEALGTVLETTSLGSFGASKAPTALKILTPGKNILKNAKIGAAYGGVFGTGFGVSGAAQKNKSSKDIITEGLIAGAVGATGGATLGGALTSAGFGLSGILKKTSKYSAQMKNALGKEAIKKLEKTSKDLVKMSPTASKNEAKWNKNTARFIANEFVIDEKTLKPKSILQLIDSDGKRINTDNAINALKNKYYDEANAFNSLIQDSGEYISLNQLKTKAIKSLGDDLKARGSDYDEAIKYINKEINAYKKNYRDAGLIDGNDLLLPISKLNKIKTGLWNKTSNFNPSQKDKLLSDINYKLGQTAKDLIEESVEDVAVKRMNQRLGDFASAIKVLENANGKVLPGGFFGRQFTRLAGTVAGSPGGIGGSIIGNITGGMLADIMVNPKIKTTLWTKLVKQLNKQKNGQDIINEAIEILSKRNQERAARKLLEAPKFIPLKPKSDNSRLFTQEEANALLESLKIKPKKIKLNQTGKAEPLKSKQKLNSLNPTGSVFSKYTPKQRATAELADNITTLDKTMKKPADEMITIYRGTGKGGDIVAGDFVTTNKQLAKDYAGTGRVIEKKVRLSDVLDDLDEPLGEEYIYRPQAKLKPSVEPLIEEAKKYKSAEEFVQTKMAKETDFADYHQAPRMDKAPVAKRMEDGGYFSLREVANGKTTAPSDFFDERVGARYYMYDNLEGQQSFTAINNIIRAEKNGIKDRTITAYRAVPKNVKVDKLQDGDWVSFSKEYAEQHGMRRFDGKYKLIEQEVSPDDVWWDANDINEWGYDTGKGNRRKTVKEREDELTEIWNKAHKEVKPSVVEPLIEEAKKYKTADEFVKAQRTNKLYHVSDNPNLKLSKDYQPNK